MGNPSSPVCSPRVGSTVFSAVTVFVPFVAPQMVALSSVLVMLIDGVQEIMGITEKSKLREFVDFGRCVQKMASRVVSALQNNRFAQQADVRKSLEEFHQTIHSISRQLSYINPGGLTYRIRCLLLLEDDHISRMRQQLDDAWTVFQIAAFVKLLEDPNSPTGGTVVDVSGPGQTHTPIPHRSSNAPSQDLPYTQRNQGSRARGLLLNVCPSFSGFEDHEAQPNMQRAEPRYTHVAVARSSDPEDGEITVVFLNVERRRRSLQHDRSPIKTMQLAAALDCLSALLAKAGRIREALEASQESAELYRTLAH
ncbi:unnamed protein product [Rhizoctonia solani]|uniref:Uncharacterized protein n=1 Tax=Rhizoctonia solani TaxID=456999 RepID=A0A8H3AP89_9AGAM|nr:unnamed protein product [Rhizoctonia solani]